MCESKELIVGYLYDDLSDQERRSFEAHLASCDACRGELAALRATRGHLALWSPPERELGFRMIREAEATRARVLPMRSRWTAAFGLAAAAAIVLAAATAIANLEIRYDANGLLVRTGWGRAAATETATRTDGDASAIPTAATDAPATDFSRLDQRLRELERITAQSSGSTQLASGPRMSDAEMLRRVRQLVTEAESRQQTTLARTLLQVVQDMDRQRRTDLATLQQGLGQYQGLTNAEIAHTREIVNQLVRTSAKQEK